MFQGWTGAMGSILNNYHPGLYAIQMIPPSPLTKKGEPLTMMTGLLLFL